jgi:hypothetical protein
MLDKTVAFIEWAEGVQGVNNAASAGLLEAAREEVRLIRSLPLIVVLIGSSRFERAFAEEAERMVLEGQIVLGKHVFKPGREWDRPEQVRDLIHALQFRYVDLADRVHIVNVDGYIGYDTYNVIKYALRADKAITFRERMVKLLDGGQVTRHHFLQATRQSVEFESATLG